ncbi:hypothetical protein BC830DRAFT_1143090 [Chytriomyces sp. MP71]|nr:hypothetical protein BC830DRAFT_1143090 [Chytriomyces sp. MP71]
MSANVFSRAAVSLEQAVERHHHEAAPKQGPTPANSQLLSVRRSLSRHSLASSRSSTSDSLFAQAVDVFATRHWSVATLRDALANTPAHSRNVVAALEVVGAVRKCADRSLDQVHAFGRALQEVDDLAWGQASQFAREAVVAELDEVCGEPPSVLYRTQDSTSLQTIKYIQYQQKQLNSGRKHPLLQPLLSVQSAISAGAPIDFDALLLLKIKATALSHSQSGRSTPVGWNGNNSETPCDSDAFAIWGIEGVVEALESAAWNALEVGIANMILWLDKVCDGKPGSPQPIAPTRSLSLSTKIPVLPSISKSLQPSSILPSPSAKSKVVRTDSGLQITDSIANSPKNQPQKLLQRKQRRIAAVIEEEVLERSQAHAGSTPDVRHPSVSSASTIPRMCPTPVHDGSSTISKLLKTWSSEAFKLITGK